MGPYFFTFFIILLISLTGVILYLQFEINNEKIYNLVPINICPTGCLNGMCKNSEQCNECDPLNMRCCCYDDHCKNCIDRTNISRDTDNIDNKYIKKENNYIIKLNEKIKNINNNLK